MKKITAIVLSAIMLILMAVPAFAAGTINTITINFSETKEDPGYIRQAEPNCATSNCEIVDWECSKDYGEWTPGNKVTFTVIVEPNNGYNFSSNNTTVRVNGSNTELASKTIKSGQATLKINYWPSITFADPTNLYWDDYTGCWDKVEYCKKYEVQVTIDNGEKTTTKSLTTTTNSVDLSNYATDGDITFKVRAVPASDTQKKYCTSSNWVDSNEGTSPASDNTSVGSFSGTGDKMYFKDYAGNRVTGWQKINNIWYYFEPAGNDHYAYVNRWANINGKWYYFRENGAMATGWVPSNGFWYYLDTTNGDMMTGWIQPSINTWYYLEPTGSAEHPVGSLWMNTTTPDGYKVDEKGVWVK